MPQLTIQGITIPVASLVIADATAGSEGLTDTGHTWRSEVGATVNSLQLSTRLAVLEDAEAFALLLIGAGEVWSNSDYGSKGTLLETSMATSSSAKFGTHHFAPPSVPDDFVDLANVPGLEVDDGWTVFMWFDSGGGYVHYGLSSDGTKFEAGAVNGAATLPFSVTAGMVSLDTAGDFDDVVVLPFVFPTDWIASLDLTQAFAPLPALNAGGDFWYEPLTVEAEDEVSLTPQMGTTRWAVSVKLRTLDLGAPILDPADVTDVALWHNASILSSLWQDSARTIPVTEDGQTVEAWDDLSGNGRHSTNATGTATYSESGFNGMPCVDFANLSTQALSTAAFTHGTTGGMSLFFVYRNDEGASTSYMIYRGSGGSARIPFATDAGTGTGPGFHDGAHKSFGMSAVHQEDDAHAVVFEAGGTVRFYQQDAELGSSAYTDFADASEAHRIGSGPGTGPMDGVVCEYILINREVSEAERTGILNYLAARWKKS